MVGYRRLFVFLLFLGPFFMMSPESARAQDTLPNCTAQYACNPGDCNCENKRLQCAQTIRAQGQSNPSLAPWANGPTINLANSCLQAITNALKGTTLIPSLQSFVTQALNSIVSGIINSACNTISGPINQVKGMSSSQINLICIPNFSMTFGSISLPTLPSCSGTPLAALGPSPASPPISNPSGYSFSGVFGGH